MEKSHEEADSGTGLAEYSDARDFWAALKDRLKELAAVAGKAWSDGHKKELLALARAGAGGCFKHRRGDFFNFWRAVIFGSAKTGELGRPKECLEVLLSAAAYGMEQRLRPGPWFIGNAAKLWWRKISEGGSDVGE